MPFLCCTIFLNLIKMQIPFDGAVRIYPALFKVCFATTGICVFCALTSVGAFFILRKNVSVP